MCTYLSRSASFLGAKAPEVKGVKFRNSDYTATQVKEMALAVMRRCSSVDAYGKTVVLGGYEQFC